MNKDTAVYLDSYRLAQFAECLPCHVCGEGNSHEAEHCRRCFAPMALTHQSSGQKQAPLMIAALGASGVGKTVYLGMLLDMLSRRSKTLHLLTRGAISIEMQQNTVFALANGAFPNKTPIEPDRWNWVHCQIAPGRRRKIVDLIIPDMAGESMLTEITHPHTYAGIRPFLSRCSGIMLLIDPTKVRAGHQDQDFFSVKLLSYLRELDLDLKTGWPQRPIALVFSKADQCPDCQDDPNRFAERHLPGMWRFCRERFQRYRYFAAGVAGACAYRNQSGADRVRVPLRVEPSGVVEPFEWLVNELCP